MNECTPRLLLSSSSSSSSIRVTERERNWRNEEEKCIKSGDGGGEKRMMMIRGEKCVEKGVKKEIVSQRMIVSRAKTEQINEGEVYIEIVRYDFTTFFIPILDIELKIYYLKQKYDVRQEKR